MFLYSVGTQKTYIKKRKNKLYNKKIKKRLSTEIFKMMFTYLHRLFSHVLCFQCFLVCVQFNIIRISVLSQQKRKRTTLTTRYKTDSYIPIFVGAALQMFWFVKQLMSNRMVYLKNIYAALPKWLKLIIQNFPKKPMPLVVIIEANDTVRNFWNFFKGV